MVQGHQKQARRRARTFTGCITCRRRKVKFNSPPFPCADCRRLGLECISPFTQNLRHSEFKFNNEHEGKEGSRPDLSPTSAGHSRECLDQTTSISTGFPSHSEMPPLFSYDSSLILQVEEPDPLFPAPNQHEEWEGVDFAFSERVSATGAVWVTRSSFMGRFRHRLCCHGDRCPQPTRKRISRLVG